MLQDSKVLQLIEKWSGAPEMTEIKVQVSTKIEKSPEETVPAPVMPSVLPSATEKDSITETIVVPVENIADAVSTVEEEQPSTLPETGAIETIQEPIKEEKMEIEECEENIETAKEEQLVSEESKPIADTTPEPVEHMATEQIEQFIWEFVAAAKTLLNSWADLKEVFRIPKKERVEQMKEHEREADKGSSESSIISYGYDRDR